MKHAYLTKEEIDYSYRKGAITLREAKELLVILNGAAKRVVHNKIARHGTAALHRVA